MLKIPPHLWTPVFKLPSFFGLIQIWEKAQGEFRWQIWLGDKLDQVAWMTDRLEQGELKTSEVSLSVPRQTPEHTALMLLLLEFELHAWHWKPKDAGFCLYRPIPLKILEICNLNTLSLPYERSKLAYCSHLSVVLKNYLKKGGYLYEGEEQSSGRRRKNWKHKDQKQKAFGLSSKCSPIMSSSGNDSCERQS